MNDVELGRGDVPRRPACAAVREAEGHDQPFGSVVAVLRSDQRQLILIELMLSAKLGRRTVLRDGGAGSAAAADSPSHVAAGDGARSENGQIQPLDVGAGDRVLFGKWAGTEVTIDGEELVIMKESDIMGIIG